MLSLLSTPGVHLYILTYLQNLKVVEAAKNDRNKYIASTRSIIFLCLISGIRENVRFLSGSRLEGPGEAMEDKSQLTF